MRDIKYIVIHCTASYQATTTETSLRAAFKSRGWSTVGYHWVVKTDGNIIKLLDESKISNGVKGYNKNSVHIAWIGGIDKTHPNGIDNRTPAQKIALYDLIAKVKARYPKAKILGHRDFSPDLNHNGIVDPWEYIKACPCFNCLEEYKELNEIRK